jgi:hypothetical protein
MALQGDGVVSAAMLASGQSVPCEMVIAGIGVLPVTEMLANSGIEVADGILVNEFLETSQPDIYTAGDVANYQDVLFTKRRRVEHWDMPSHRVNTVREHSWENNFPLSTFRISFPMSLIFPTSTGATRPWQIKLSIAAICPAIASAYRACGRSKLWQRS